MIRIAVAEDDLLIREGIQRVLQSEGDLELVAVAADAPELLEAVERHAPEIVLTDLKLPPGYATEGVELAHGLRSSHPEIGVIVISQYAELHEALSLIDHGMAGRGLLLEDQLAQKDHLAGSIRQVAGGEPVFDPRLVELLVKRSERATHSLLSRLTRREYDVLSEIATGKSNAAIARTLVITKHAVEAHVSAIFAKLDLPSTQTVSRRVTATLLFLADTSARPSSARPSAAANGKSACRRQQPSTTTNNCSSLPNQR
jgi:DNA-binding NarL/FixJ family response regulator